MESKEISELPLEEVECYKFILIFNSGDCQNMFIVSHCLYAAPDYVIDAHKSLSHGNLGTC